MSTTIKVILVDEETNTEIKTIRIAWDHGPDPKEAADWIIKAIQSDWELEDE